jgi:hypothetical protein
VGARALPQDRTYALTLLSRSLEIQYQMSHRTCLAGRSWGCSVHPRGCCQSRMPFCSQAMRWDIEHCCGAHVANIPLRSAGRGAGRAATKRLRYMPQKRPKMLPTMILRWTGTKVKLKMATSGQTFHPLIIRGQTSLRQSRMIVVLSFPLKAAIAAMNANVLTAAPKV